MQYITSAQAAEKWGISTNRVTMLAKNGQILGAKKVGHQWMIPENADKPADGRTKAAKENLPSDAPFRFPLYLNFQEESYSPPLSDEERLLRNAAQAFYACRFDEAEELLAPLCSKDVNIYVRQAALFLRCYLAVYTPVEEYFDALLYDWNAALSEDFPYKKEMLLLRSAFVLDYGYYKPIFEGFCVDPNYPYHSSVQYILFLIALVPIESGKLSLLSEIRYDTQELLCQLMERDGHFFEAQQLHFLLLIVYQLKCDKERMSFHIRRGIQFAAEMELYFYPAYYFGYYPEVMQEVICEFPSELGEKIRALSEVIHESYNRFTVTRKEPSFLGILSDREFEYAFLTSQGYTNREIAHKLSISVSSVSKIYEKIRDKLNVKSKRELIDLINRTHCGPKE